MANVAGVEAVSCPAKSKLWPLNDGGYLPSDIFTQDHLYKVFFELLPAYFQMSITDIRQGLKSYLKKFPSIQRTSVGEQSARDLSMVSAVTMNALARNRLKEISFIHEGTTRFNGGRKRRKPTLPNLDFSGLIWNSYSADPDLQEIVKWFSSTSIEVEGTGGKMFILAQDLTNAWEDGECPGGAGSIDFARIVLLYASLNDADNCIGLIRAAYELGCKWLSDFLETPANEVLDGSEPIPSGLEATIKLSIPHLNAFSYSRDSSEWAVPSLVSECVDTLRCAEKILVSTKDAACEIFKKGVGPIIEGAGDKWEYSIEALQLARRALISQREAQIEIKNLELEIWGAILDRLEIRKDIRELELPSNENSLLAIAKIKDSIFKLAPSEWIVQSWISVNGSLTVDALWTLVDKIGSNEQRNKVWSEYRVSVCEYLKVASSSQVKTLLTNLKIDSMGAVLQGLQNMPWVVGGAIIFRAILDGSRGQLPEFLEEILLGQKNDQARRQMLRYLPISAVGRFSESGRRAIAVERFRDVFEIGPLAQITNPIFGLMDPDLVGKTVSEICELIAANLSIFSSGLGVTGSLRANSHSRSATLALVEYINKPVTMRGNFRRLREMAREQLLQPLLRNDSPDLTAVVEILESLESGRAGSALFLKLKESRPDDPLEQRHREQLDRYLGYAITLIKEFIAERKSDTDIRLKTVGKRLQKLLGQLRGEGGIGTIPWFESKVKSILNHEEGFSGNIIEVVIGNDNPILSQDWKAEDTYWAAEILAIPEFYYSAAPSFSDVVCSIMKYSCINTPPGSVDILDDLVDHKDFVGAFKFVQDEADERLAEKFGVSVEGPSLQLNERFDSLVLKYGQAVVDGFEEGNYFKLAMQRYDFDVAFETLEFLEILIVDAVSNGSFERAQKEVARRSTLSELLTVAGVDVPVSMSLDCLENLWGKTVFERVEERKHFRVIDSAFGGADLLLPAFAVALEEFRTISDRANYWLPVEISSDLSSFTQDAAIVLAGWAKNAKFFVPEEREATVVLTTKFLAFIAEQSQLMHSASDSDVVAALMSEVLDVAGVILDASGPANCLAQLRLITVFLNASSELKQDDTSENHVNDFREEGAKLTESASIDDADRRHLPEELVELIRLNEWDAVLHAALSVLPNSSEQSQERLASIINVAKVLSGSNIHVDVEMNEHLPSAASWLSQNLIAATLLPEGQRVDLAFRVLTGAISLDAEQAIPRLINTGSSWAELLKSSPFRRMLISGPPPLTSRVLELLVTGSIGPLVAEKLWEAATNSTDAYVYRSSLLMFLNEHEALDAIVRLASRHEPSIASRLPLLFELRTVASNRPDLVPVAQSVTDQLGVAAKGAPFRAFLKGLPTASQAIKANFKVNIEDAFRLRDSRKGAVPVELPITIIPEGLVPTKVEAILYPEDDVTFEDNTRRAELSNRPIYFASEMSLRVVFGPSWFGSRQNKREGVRVRIRAITVTEERFQVDEVCLVRRPEVLSAERAILNNDTLLDSYPGVSNTPAIDDTFIGRVDELELLNQVLVSARRPSPVLLTGMRRVGKTSLLFAFHRRFKQPGNSGAVTFYLSLAERRVEFVSHERSVAASFFRAVSHGLVRPNLTATDQNYPLCAKIRNKFDGDWRAARREIEGCYDDESLSDSLKALSSKLIEWMGPPMERFLLLLDEAEALVAPYQAGGVKKLELEQLLQSLREVSQTTGDVGILLSGSNHINIFAREYKNAFFGSSQIIELGGLKDAREASALIAPNRIAPYVQFDQAAIDYAFNLCAGIPQFLWQIGAATAHLVRNGAASKTDIRVAVATLIGEGKASLPFKSYEILEPIDSLLSLEGGREGDLLWMLLYRVADASSLVVEDATILFVVDNSLMSVDDKAVWNQRLRALVDLKIIRMDSSSSVRFQVPLFAEGFRAPKNWQEFNIRLQQVSE